MEVSDKFIKVINLHFNSLFKGREFCLPERVLTGKIYEISSGYEKYAQKITFLISSNGEYCDYLIRSYSYASHQRISIDGNLQELENYEAQFGWPVLENESDTQLEHERIKKHNEEVYKILMKKGLVKK